MIKRISSTKETIGFENNAHGNPPSAAVGTMGRLSLQQTTPHRTSSPTFAHEFAKIDSPTSSGTLSTERISSPTPSISLTSSEEEKSFASSVRLFKNDVGRARFMHGVNYRTLIGSLESYERNEASLNEASSEEKEQRLQAVLKNAFSYLAQKEKQLAIHARTARKSDDPKWQQELQRLQRARRATLSLIDDIASEMAGYSFQISFRQTAEKRSQDGFASGAMASVSKIEYTDGTVAIFKPVSAETPMESTIANNASIPGDSTLAANLTGRAVATSLLCEKLHWGALVPRTDFAMHNNQIGSAQIFAEGESLHKEKWVPVPADEIVSSLTHFGEGASFFLSDCIEGTVMDQAKDRYQLSCIPPLIQGTDDRIYEKGEPIDRARGVELLKSGAITVSAKIVDSVSAVDFSNPHLQRTLSKAQLLDFLTGQLDRNVGNFIYSHDPGPPEKWDAALIDNDLSFPPQNFTAPLPLLIDREAAESLLNLTPEALRTTLEGTGLTETELLATEQRLETLQDWIQRAEANNTTPAHPNEPRLIDTWDETTFAASIAAPENAKANALPTNYVARGYEDKRLKKEEQELPGLEDRARLFAVLPAAVM